MYYLILILSFLFISCASTNKRAQMGDSLDTSIESSDLSSEVEGSDSGKIEGLFSVYFAYDRSSLSLETRRNLSKNADWIRNSGQTVQLEGHCDNRGSSEYNLALGERRAISVKNYLISLGVDSNQLTVISYGEEKPLHQGESEAELRKNRRVNFIPLR